MKNRFLFRRENKNHEVKDYILFLMFNNHAFD